MLFCSRKCVGDTRMVFWSRQFQRVATPGFSLCLQVLQDTFLYTIDTASGATWTLTEAVSDPPAGSHHQAPLPHSSTYSSVSLPHSRLMRAPALYSMCTAAYGFHRPALTSRCQRPSWRMRSRPRQLRLNGALQIRLVLLLKKKVT